MRTSKQPCHGLYQFHMELVAIIIETNETLCVIAKNNKRVGMSTWPIAKRQVAL